MEVHCVLDSMQGGYGKCESGDMIDGEFVRDMPSLNQISFGGIGK